MLRCRGDRNGDDHFDHEYLGRAYHVLLPRLQGPKSTVVTLHA
jgi:hypothetical protein